MPKLSKIRLGENDDLSGSLSDKEIATLLSSCRNGWKVVEIRETAEFYEASAAALIKHHNTLEVLVVGGAYFESEDLVSLLSSAPNLRVLISIDDECYNDRPPAVIRANKFIDMDPATNSLKTWACDSCIKILKVKITEIPRPDLGARYGVVKESYDGQGREIQGQVYERLARFTSLETLWLGHHPDVESEKGQGGPCPDQMDCLEMSLDSGLQRLEGLKELRELSLANMNTRIGLDEVQWMAKHWPKLRVIRGLDGRKANRIEGEDSGERDENEDEDDFQELKDNLDFWTI
ncbi:hypothetical protein BGX26_001993 [Mortierella sp. AD094]|nr:hypothetical protein BGX26_001993 [Mortierella sp. AD094]